ncbi:hypothetical protein DSCA_49840 [Desulfosarcina alkanivorans]|jgi:hypothetical protein|uniref:Uncharacterized protein n=1 Tax=Desulfosarcina alkanivorans TaxID=571177 RepID=A0A5K7YXN3_9BACT|nr:hypothetical protein DSCA_49840 [Desulfosarcina alkanivorans]
MAVAEETNGGAGEAGAMGQMDSLLPNILDRLYTAGGLSEW